MYLVEAMKRAFHDDRYDSHNEGSRWLRKKLSNLLRNPGIQKRREIKSASNDTTPIYRVFL